jgi:6,7-dimethyl-8-ribityllumazine synthase
MSISVPQFQGDARGMTVAVVVARFNFDITDKLRAGAEAALKKARAERVDVFHVPGAFELPLAAARLVEDYDCIVALGAVIRGETPHFDYVCTEAARGIQQVMVETGVPVAFGVLTCDTLEQALERAGGKEGNTGRNNKGYDAAMTAIEMARFPPMRPERG